MAKVNMEFGNNSDAYKKEMSESSHPKKVTTGTLRKKPLSEKFVDLFFEGDLKSAVNYIIYDVAIPQVKTAIIEGIKVMFYGSSRGADSKSVSSGSRTSYASYYYNSGKTNQQTPKREGVPSAVKKFDPRLITVSDRGTAEKILSDMKKHIEEYGHVTVADLFDMVDIPSEWTSYDYGWVSLDGGRVRPCQEGYWFDLPEPYPIN